jgi:hypothetical protein
MRLMMSIAQFPVKALIEIQKARPRTLDEA